MDNEETRGPNDHGTLWQDKKLDKSEDDVELEEGGYDNDSFEVEQPSDLEEEVLYEGEEWDAKKEPCRLY